MARRPTHVPQVRVSVSLDGMDCGSQSFPLRSIHAPAAGLRGRAESWRGWPERFAPWRRWPRGKR